MEGTKDITRSYTNLLCIHTNVYIVENLGTRLVFPFVAGIATRDVELGSFCRERKRGREREGETVRKNWLIRPMLMTVTYYSTPHGSLPRISDKGQSIDR